jgi:hypothetical protein
MSYLRYLCLFAYSGVQKHIVVWFCFSSSCVSHVASFSELSVFECPFGVLYRLYKFTNHMDSNKNLELAYVLQNIGVYLPHH